MSFYVINTFARIQFLFIPKVPFNLSIGCFRRKSEQLRHCFTYVNFLKWNISGWEWEFDWYGSIGCKKKRSTIIYIFKLNWLHLIINIWYDKNLTCVKQFSDNKWNANRACFIFSQADSLLITLRTTLT